MASAASTTLDFERAAKNAQWVVENAGGKRKSYLTANFDITQKEKDQAAPADLVKVVAKAFTASADPKKLVHASNIFTHLAAMAPATTAPALVKQFLPVLEKARLKEIPRQLSMLLQVKEIINFQFRQAEKNLAAIPATKFIAEHAIIEPGAKRGVRGFCELRDQPTTEELLEILETTEGLALLQRFPAIFDHSGAFFGEEAGPDDLRLLKTFADRSSGVCSAHAAKYYWFALASKANKDFQDLQVYVTGFGKSQAFMMNYTDCSTTVDGPRVPNPYYQPNHIPFLEKTFPLFNMLLKFYVDRGPEFEDIEGANYHKLNLEFYDKCRKVESKIAELNDQYRALYAEFDALNRKYTPDGSALPALPPSAFPSIYHVGDEPLVFPALPTPEAFAAMPCRLAVTDLSPSYPPLPVRKPAPKSIELPVPAPIKAVVQSREIETKREEKQDRKEAKKETYAQAAIREDVKQDQPRRPSLFAKRTFAFSQKAQRVLDWETAPQRPLAVEPYSSMPAALQKEQTWRHGCSVLDPFVGTSYSRKGEWTNNRGEKQTAYFIQAEVEYAGKTTRCVFQYAFDKDKVLYHRYAGERSNVQIVDDLLAKNKYENDFPTLDKSFELFKNKPETVKVEIPGEVIYAVDPLEVITVVDEKHGLTIRIFKQG